MTDSGMASFACAACGAEGVVLYGWCDGCYEYRSPPWSGEDGKCAACVRSVDNYLGHLRDTPCGCPYPCPDIDGALAELVGVRGDALDAVLDRWQEAWDSSLEDYLAELYHADGAAEARAALHSAVGRYIDSDLADFVGIQDASARAAFFAVLDRWADWNLAVSKGDGSA